MWTARRKVAKDRKSRIDSRKIAVRKSTVCPVFFFIPPKKCQVLISTLTVLFVWLQTDFPRKRVHPIPYTKWVNYSTDSLLEARDPKTFSLQVVSAEAHCTKTFFRKKLDHTNSIKQTRKSLTKIECRPQTFRPTLQFNQPVRLIYHNSMHHLPSTLLTFWLLLIERQP